MIANSDHRLHPTRALACAAAPLVVAGLAFCFYLPGLARFPLPGDSSLYVTRSCHLWVNSYAQTHSLYLLAGHVAVNALPWLRPPFVLALMSAAFAAAALGFVYATIRRITGGSAGAVAGTAALAVSHTFWFHAEFAEVYSLNALFMTAMLYCAVRWWEAALSVRDLGPSGRGSPSHIGAEPLGDVGSPGECRFLCLMAFLGGLGCANHPLAGVSLAVCGIWAAVLSFRHRRPVAHLLAAGVAGLAGLSLLLVLLARDAQILGWAKAVQMALFGGGGIRGDKLILYSGDMGRLFGAAGLKQVMLSVGALGYNFAGVLAWFAGGLVVRRLRRGEAPPCADGQAADDLPPPAHDPRPTTHGDPGENLAPAIPRKAVVALLFCLFGVHFAFGATYTIHEGWAFLLPAWVALACLWGIVLDRRAAARAVPGFCRRTWGLVTCIVAVPVVLYAIAPWGVVKLAGQRLEAKAAPHYMLTPKQYLSYYLWPPKSAAGGRAVWLESVLNDLPEGATLLLSPANHAMAHYYRQVERRRPDLVVRGVSKAVLSDALVQNQTVFVDRLNEVEMLGHEGSNLRTRQTCGLWAVEREASP